MSDYQQLLILPHVIVHNANALSSPFTIGFPAMTAWLGATHALQRHLNSNGLSVKCIATGVVSHHVDLQTYRGDNDYVASIVGTGNPLEPKPDKNKPKGNAVRPSFIEEARCHLDVSLVVELQGLDYAEQEYFLEHVNHILQAKMRIAGGDILQFDTPYVCVVERDVIDDAAFKKLSRQLMPGYALIERRDLMIDAMEQGQDAMDALMDYLVVHHHCEEDDAGIVHWQSTRKQYYDPHHDSFVPTGWLVPIATGFQGISDIAYAKNQRDECTPHCFAESLVTLGEFKMLYHFNHVNQMLWRYHYDQNNALYQCLPVTYACFNSTSTDDEFA